MEYFPRQRDAPHFPKLTSYNATATPREEQPEPLDMKLHLDRDKCQGHNRCCSLAPDLFDTDDYGMAVALHGGAVPAGLEDKARSCVDNCPEYAIEITE